MLGVFRRLSVYKSREMSLTDAAGTCHVPAGASPRIVSLVPSITELVCDLGLAPQLVGRTGFCVHPRDVLRHVPKLGGTKDVKLDALRVLEPTHIILNKDENTLEVADELRRTVPNLIVTHPLGPADNPALYRLIGGIFGRGEEAELLCERFDAALARARAAAEHFPRETALYLIWREPWMTVSRDLACARALALAGWDTVPVTCSSRYPEIALDEPSLAGVRTVLLSSEPYRFREKHLGELRRMKSMKEKRITLIDGEMCSWYGSRAIAGLDYLTGFRRRMDAADCRGARRISSPSGTSRS